MSQKSPAVFIREFAEHINVLALGLVVYEPNATLEEEEYHGGITQRFVPIGRFADEVEKAIVKLQVGEELGLSSEYVDYQGNRQHFFFADMALIGMAPEMVGPYTGLIPVASSPNHWHFYSKRTVSDFARLQAYLLLLPGIDTGWVAAGLCNGFNVLRLSAQNAVRFPFPPHFLETP